MRNAEHSRLRERLTNSLLNEGVGLAIYGCRGLVPTDDVYIYSICDITLIAHLMRLHVSRPLSLYIERRTKREKCIYIHMAALLLWTSFKPDPVHSVAETCFF